MMEEEAMLRIRVVFDDPHLLNKFQRSQGLHRCWLLLKPGITTSADLASHLRKTFGIRSCLVLSIDEFVLPPFESTCIIKDKDIIRVKQKDTKLKDVYKLCDGQNLTQDPQTVMELSFPVSSNMTADDKSQETSQGNDNNNMNLDCHFEDAVHAREPSSSILMLKQKREHLLELHDALEQSEELKHSHARELRTACNEFLSASRKNGRYRYKKLTCEERNNGTGIHKTPRGLCIANCAWLDQKSKGNSLGKRAKPDKHCINFAALFPLTRSPMKGDILAYRLVEPSSKIYLELSSPQVGKVSAFDHISSKITLVSVPEVVVFLEEDSKRAISRQAASTFKDDSPLEIMFSKLFDVRLLHAYDSRELACLREGTPDPARKDNREAALTDSYHSGKDLGWTNRTSNERKTAASCSSRSSPAESLFWETFLSKRLPGKGC